MTNTPITECRPSGNPTKSRVGVGMPAALYLHEFGELLSHAFDGEIAYHVGSSLTKMTWRDVDVRVMLDPEAYKAMKLGDPKSPQENAKWTALCMAFSELGRKMTGLPIDFQIQERDTANAEYPRHEDNPRSAMILGRVRQQNFFKAGRDEPSNA